MDELFPAIGTSRLHLRCPVPQDAAALSAMMTPAISQGLASWPIPFTPHMARQRISAARNAASQGDALPCVMSLQDSGVLVGWISLTRTGRQGELSYWLGEAHHGRGFAREAVGALLLVGFERLTLDVIEAGARLDNAASFAVLRACGMQEAGERMVYAPAREGDEPCRFYQRRRPVEAGRNYDTVAP